MIGLKNKLYEDPPGLNSKFRRNGDQVDKNLQKLCYRHLRCRHGKDVFRYSI